MVPSSALLSPTLPALSVESVPVLIGTISSFVEGGGPGAGAGAGAGAGPGAGGVAGAGGTTGSGSGSGAGAGAGAGEVSGMVRHLDASNSASSPNTFQVPPVQVQAKSIELIINIAQSTIIIAILFIYS